ncbi:MAG: exodeoxyribonuclease III [Elainellaceae cyanobacterium]
MQIATWNVNSVRSRLEQVTDWLQNSPVDILCLQETKVVDEDFPRSPFTELGYQTYISGQKSYNGVALVSRSSLTEVSTGFAGILTDVDVGDLDQQKRVITGVLDGVRVVNLYVPNGSSVGSDKYDYKLRWLAMLQRYLKALLADDASLLVCGDFNIALEDRDIYAPKKPDHIMASPTEREALQGLIDLGLADAFRKFTADGGHFSWWDYRTGGFSRNRGWRIDHHYLSPPLYARATACRIDVEPRKLTKPSDHAPVVVTLADA